MIKQEDLKEIRKKYNMTQRQMAIMLHCADRTYNCYELGKTKFPDSIADLLAYKLRDLENR